MMSPRKSGGKSGSFNAGQESAIGQSLKKQPDPISSSIQERKDDGSYLSVIKNKPSKMENEEITQFSVQGPGITTAQLKSDKGENVLNGQGGITMPNWGDPQFGRRKNSDRKRQRSPRKDDNLI